MSIVDALFFLFVRPLIIGVVIVFVVLQAVRFVTWMRSRG